MRKIFFFAVFFICFAVLPSCRINQIADADEQILFQNYQIQVEDGVAKIEAEIYFQDDLGKDSEKTLPMEVRFNNRPMWQVQIFPFWKTGLSVSEKGNRSITEPNSFDMAGQVPGYKISETFYKPENQFIVTDQNNRAREFNFTFDPIEFENTEGIVLSRSKDNFIKIKGKGGRKGWCGVGFGAASGKEIEDLIKIDIDKMHIFIPARAIKDLKTGEARFFIISSDTDFIDQTVRRNNQNHLVRFAGSYRITYSTETKVQIID